MKRKNALIAFMLMLPLLGTAGVPVHICRTLIDNNGSGKYEDVNRHEEIGRWPSGAISYIDITIHCAGNGDEDCPQNMSTGPDGNPVSTDVDGALIQPLNDLMDLAISAISSDNLTGSSSSVLHVVSGTGTDKYTLLVVWSATDASNGQIDVYATPIP